jgi:hypothetical protein
VPSASAGPAPQIGTAAPRIAPDNMRPAGPWRDRPVDGRDGVASGYSMVIELLTMVLPRTPSAVIVVVTTPVPSSWPRTVSV